MGNKRAASGISDKGAWRLPYVCESSSQGKGAAFIPDPEYRWDGNSL